MRPTLTPYEKPLYATVRWGRVRRAPIALLALLLAAPVASAQFDDSGTTGPVTVRPLFGFNYLELTAEALMDEGERRALADRLDADGDGAITRDEVSALENATIVRVDGWDIPQEERFVLDGRDAVVMAHQWRYTEWVGPVDEVLKAPVLKQRYYQFASPNQTSFHQIRGDLFLRDGADAGQNLRDIRLQAPNNWTIQGVSVKGLDGIVRNRSYEVDRIVLLEGLDLQRASIDWAERPPAPREQPGPGAIAALAVLVVAAWSARRWRS